MARIFLREYNREIERLIEGGHNDEAISQCRYLLRTFPKHVETYRLLGKALLEAHRYGDAADVLQRVLSSVPDDFIGHLGMSIIKEEQGDLDTAMWHMERAFEVQPANNVIQEELRRLFTARDGVAPARIQLTRGALARMYLKGDLHAQAIAELRAALAEHPERPDLQVMLARAYHRAAQRVEAAETASQLLIKFPYCLEANRILAEILLGTERASEAEIYRQRVIALDPYFAHLPLGAKSSDQAPESAVSLERYVYMPGEPFPVAASFDREAGLLGEPAEEADLPSWLDELESDIKMEGISPLEDLPVESAGPSQVSEVSPTPPTGAEPEFVIEPPTEPGPEVEPIEELDQAPELQPETPSEPVAQAGAVPDWLRDAGWETPGKESAEPGAGPPDFEGEPSAEELGLASADIPDWLRPLAPKEADQAETPASEAAALPWLEEEPAGGAGDEDVWLAAQSGTTPETPEGELPDWLQPDSEPPAEAQPASPQPEEQVSQPESAPLESPDSQEGGLPEWLRAVSEEPPATPAEDVDQWLPEELQAEAAAGEEESLTQGEPDWLQAEAEEPGAVPDWLQEAESEIGSEILSAEVPDEAHPIEPPSVDEIEPEELVSEETDWGLGAQEAPGEVPDWLRAASLEEAEAPSEEEESGAAIPEMEMPSAEEPVSGEPEWLRASLEQEEEVPDWLQAEEIETRQGEDAAEELAAEIPAVQVPETDETLAEATVIEEPVAEEPGLEEPGVEEPAATEPMWAATSEEEPSEEPDWLKVTGLEAAETAEVEEPGVEEPEWMRASQPEPTAGQDIPDWLKSALGATEEPSAPATPEEQAEFGELPEEPPLYEGDTKPIRVRWSEAMPEAPAEETPEIEGADASIVEFPTDVPPDLMEEVEEEAPAEGAVSSLAEDQDQLPEWLRAEAEPGAEQPSAELEAEPALPEPAESEPTPNWLQAAAGLIEQPPAEELPEETPAEPGFEEPPAEHLAAEQITAEPALPGEEPQDHLPDWLRAMAEKFEPAPEAERLEAEEVTPEAEREEFAAEIPVEESPLEEAPAAAETYEEPLPDWLSIEAEASTQPQSVEPEFAAPPGEEPIPAEAGMDEITAEALPTAEELAEELAESEMVAEGAIYAEAMPQIEEAEAIPVEGAEGEPVETPHAEMFGGPAEAMLEESAEMPVPAEPLDLNTASLGELEQVPGVGFILAQRIIAQREISGAFASLEELTEIPGMTPEMMAQISPYLAVSAPAESAETPEAVSPAEEAPIDWAEAEPPVVETPSVAAEMPAGEPAGEVETEAAGEPQATLVQAWNTLMAGDSDSAVEQYSALIEREQALEQIIHDLREATFRYPINVNIYQALGDAYLRSGQLQEALDAYTKAEELLR